MLVEPPTSRENAGEEGNEDKLQAQWHRNVRLSLEGGILCLNGRYRNVSLFEVRGDTTE